MREFVSTVAYPQLNLLLTHCDDERDNSSASLDHAGFLAVAAWYRQDLGSMCVSSFPLETCGLQSGLKATVSQFRAPVCRSKTMKWYKEGGG